MKSPHLRAALISLIAAASFLQANAAGSAGSSSDSAPSVAFASGAATFSSELPVLVLDTFGAGHLEKDDIDHPTGLHVFAAAANGAASFGGAATLSTPATISVRGSSSANFPKKSYTLALRDAKGKKRALPLLDLPAGDTWVLVAPWYYDPGYFNNALIYALSNRIGRWAPRTRFVEVFVNADGGEISHADYAGIYVLTERIEPGEQRVPLAKVPKNRPASESGYIFKIDPADADEFYWNTNRAVAQDGSSLVLTAPKGDDASPARQNFIRECVQEMENALHADLASGWSRRTHLDHIDRAAWVDHHILNTFSCNPDALIRSAYFTRATGGRIAAGPVWDFDRALGSYHDERSFRWDVWSGLGGADVWQAGWWGILAQDPEFVQAWIDRWQALRRVEFADDALAQLVVRLGTDITAAAAARDAARWPDNVSLYGSHAGQVEHARGWAIQRARWIDEQFVAPPAITREDGNLVFSPPPGAELVYTLDGSDPRSLGGGVGPNAQITTSPLRVRVDANAHVRSYRADSTGRFPASPWSGAVATDSASPLAPGSRLVNLSSRAWAGRGEDSLIVGVGVADTAGKRYLARAIGPGLAQFGISDAIPDPELYVFSGAEDQLRNRGWETSNEAGSMARLATSVGAFPLASGSGDSAVAPTLASGTITFQTSSDRGGIALSELYELDDHGRITNLSTRARIHSGATVLVGGFVIQGSAHQRVLIRAVGPGLRKLGITDGLAQLFLTVHAGSSHLASNQRWSTSANAVVIEKASASVGAFTLDPASSDAALFMTLPPGAYTAEVTGAAGAEGVALLEIYAVP